MVTASTNNTERSNEPSALAHPSCSAPSSSAPQNLSSVRLKTADIALQYRNANLSIFPIVDGDKKPAIESWEPYQHALPTEAEIKSWWPRYSSYSIGMIGGKVSGDLEIIDFDEQHNLDFRSLYERWKEEVDSEYPGLVDRLPRAKSRHNGYHVFYRCPGVPGNLKLSRRDATPEELVLKPDTLMHTLVETRGEGGYILCYPSPGYTMEDGSLTQIPVITQSERDFMIETARMFNTAIVKTAMVKEMKCGKEGARPGDEFNRAGDHKALLEKHGWTHLYDREDNEYWCRPGKTSGASATYHKAKHCLYVFSSNAAPLDSEKAYSNFALFTHLEADGDYKDAARKLAMLGFGELQSGVSASGGGGSSKIAVALAAVTDYLNEHYELRRNLIKGRVEMREESHDNFVEVGDYELNSLLIKMLKANLAINRDMLKHLLESDFVKSYDPFVEYFEHLQEWDGSTDYIGRLTQSVGLADPSETAQFGENLKRWLIGYVATAVDHSAVNQSAIIFAGPQGIGKSRWLEKLVPAELSKYQFTGTIYPDNKDTLIYLSECILINLDELETLKKGDIGTLKSIMTLPKITVRRPYATFSEEMMRRASFVGSINKTEFLNDETGSRRFLAFEVESFSFERMPDLDMVLAQAYQLYKNRERYWFTDAEIAQINERNKRHSIISYEEEQLLKHTRKDSTSKIWLSATEIAQAINQNDQTFRVDSRSVRNLGIALTKLGYQEKKLHGSKKYQIRTLTAGEGGMTGLE